MNNIESYYNVMIAYEKCCKPLCVKFSLPQTAFDILMFLANNPEYTSARDIVEIRHIKANLVSVNVDRLVREKLVERLPVDGDRRKFKLACTHAADPVIKSGQNMQKEFYNALLNNIDAADRKFFSSTLKKINTNVDQILKG
ncbi:MAG: MarR family transcriptional regulator [Lachnospiraceae bacterium]|jgi:DNA-binding MarR family transcriptional regulator|nr:MarR family transcriptional regulator [Lachnospiraceae bacterium]MDD4525691.1 MarR family transcriptional regulator [Lachnospiraceae bacterium]